jgi:hypothetical protein
MRIALRTGAGRGVYELAGRQGNLNASDLFDREIFYELTPSIIIPGRAIASRRSGKPRILLDERERTTHFYRLLAAVLLLPKPKRQFKMTHGSELLKFEAYSMTAIKVDVSDITRSKVVLRPTDLLLENADSLQTKVEFTQRMSRIARLWERASGEKTPLAQLINDLKRAILIADPDYKAIEDCAQKISDAVKTDGDPLPIVEQLLGISDAQNEPVPRVNTPQFTHQADFGVEDDTSPVEARFERIKQWRQLAVRGAAGQRFRNDVTGSYDFRCLFSGQRLPKTAATESAGVDAAHILPWSTHNINSVANGLCLNKLCHWAFDAGVVKLSFDRSCGAYLIEIPKEVRRAARMANFDLIYFETIVGQIPEARLPKTRKLWPSPNYLVKLNEFMFGQTPGLDSGEARCAHELDLGV